jgi:hypothetical protein
MKIGSVASVGRHPASGLTLAFSYSALVSRETASLSSPYLALIASICGLSACTESVDSTCCFTSGSVATLTAAVSATTDQPYE